VPTTRAAWCSPAWRDETLWAAGRLPSLHHPGAVVIHPSLHRPDVTRAYLAPLIRPSASPHPQRPMGPPPACVPLAGAAMRQAADSALVAATRRAADTLSAGDTRVAVFPLAPEATATPPATARLPPGDPPPLRPRAFPGPCAAPVLLPVPLLSAPAVALGGDGAVPPAHLSRVPSAPASAASVAQPSSPPAVQPARLSRVPSAPASAASVAQTSSSPAVRPSVAVNPAAPLAGTQAVRGPSAVFVSAHEAAAAASAEEARASAAARDAGATAAVARGESNKRKRPAPTVEPLEAALHGVVDAWVASKRPRAEDLRGSSILPVPQSVPDNASTTKATLRDLCRERTIAFGDTDSEHSLRTSLRRFNACSTTVWGARMQFAAIFLHAHAEQDRGKLLPSQAAMYHPPDVGVYGTSYPSAAGRLPRLPPVPVFRARPSADAGSATTSSCPSTTPSGRPPTYSSTPPIRQSFPPSPLPAPRLLTPTGRPPLFYSALPQPWRTSSPTPPFWMPTTPSSPAASLGESSDADSGGSSARFRRSPTLYVAKMAEAMAEEDAEVA